MSSKQVNDARLAELRRWLRTFPGIDVGSLRTASADASFRRYFRVDTDAGSRIVMDAPPPEEDCRPFVAVAGYLGEIGLNAPSVIESDLDRGYLLLSDLGDRQYLDHIQGDRDRLYADAIDALIRLCRHGDGFRASLPPYDDEFLDFEMSLFRDWLCERYLGISIDEAEWARLREALIESALGQPMVFVHRDYHSRNLMLCDEGNPGVLDFQDAMNGPLTYDLVSLLKDCYVRFPRQFVDAQLRRFYAGIDEPGADWSGFMRWFDLMGVQRHLKVAGIFARLNLRDGKTRYMQDIPLALSYIRELAGRYVELDWITALIESEVLPAVEARL